MLSTVLGVAQSLEPKRQRTRKAKENIDQSYAQVEVNNREVLPGTGTYDTITLDTGGANVVQEQAGDDTTTRLAKAETRCDARRTLAETGYYH